MLQDDFVMTPGLNRLLDSHVKKQNDLIKEVKILKKERKELKKRVSFLENQNYKPLFDRYEHRIMLMALEINEILKYLKEIRNFESKKNSE